MGLDNFAMDYWNKEPLDSIHFELSRDRKSLCSGMCSTDSNAIRGKVYNDLVEYASTISLYTEIISTEQVETIIEGLKELNFESFVSDTGNPYQNDKEDVTHLIHWFTVVKEQNGIVTSWY